MSGWRFWQAMSIGSGLGTLFEMGYWLGKGQPILGIEVFAVWGLFVGVSILVSDRMDAWRDRVRGSAA